MRAARSPSAKSSNIMNRRFPADPENAAGGAARLAVALAALER